jgi:hypothetical protein
MFTWICTCCCCDRICRWTCTNSSQTFICSSLGPLIADPTIPDLVSDTLKQLVSSITGLHSITLVANDTVIKAVGHNLDLTGILPTIEDIDDWLQRREKGAAIDEEEALAVRAVDSPLLRPAISPT